MAVSRTPVAPKPRKQIGSIRVGCRLLRVLEAQNGALSLKELAARAGMSPSKTHGYLASFVAEKLVRQDAATGCYGLGPFAMQLGAAAMRQFNVIELAQEDAMKLCEASQCSVFLTIWGNRGPTIVYKIDGPSPLTLRVGHVLPLLGSASGQLYMAFLPRPDTKELLDAELSALSLNERPNIPSLIKRVRAANLAGRVTPRIPYMTMAAPVLQHDGKIVASLSISRPTQIIGTSEQQRLGRLVRDAATSISHKLGYPTRRDGDA